MTAREQVLKLYGELNSEGRLSADEYLKACELLHEIEFSDDE